MKIRILRSVAAPGWMEPIIASIEEHLRRILGRVGDTVSITADTSISTTGGSYFVDATAGPVTIALPPAASAAGSINTVKKIDASGNAVTIDGDDSETIDGATTQAINSQWDSLTVQSDGTEWFVI